MGGFVSCRKRLRDDSHDDDGENTDVSLFFTLPIDLVDMIARRSGLAGWLALCRTCKRFSALAFGSRRDAIIAAFTVAVHNAGEAVAVEWRVGPARHRDGDLPAVIQPTGTREWWNKGKRDRDGNLPAIMYACGARHWYKKGKRVK